MVCVAVGLWADHPRAVLIRATRSVGHMSGTARAPACIWTDADATSSCDSPAHRWGLNGVQADPMSWTRLVENQRGPNSVEGAVDGGDRPGRCPVVAVEGAMTSAIERHKEASLRPVQARSDQRLSKCSVRKRAPGRTCGSGPHHHRRRPGDRISPTPRAGDHRGQAGR